MLEGEPAFYLVRETKSTTSELARRGNENLKIQAPKAIDVSYGVATSWSQVVDSLPRDTYPRGTAITMHLSSLPEILLHHNRPDAIDMREPFANRAARLYRIGRP